MHKKRVWSGAAIFILLVAAMYALNAWSLRPKPPPDVDLEGRLAMPLPEEPAPAVEPSEETAENDEAAPEPQEEADTMEATPPSDAEKAVVAKAKGSLVKLETDKGDIYLDLYDDQTPITVGSFLELVGKGYYDGLKFHRVIPDFMIQGGCPRGDGTGGPGFTIPDEADKGLKHVRGSLSMAKTAAPNTGGSQFFVCHSPQPHLDGVHTVFGECVQGMDVVDKIGMGDSIKQASILKKSSTADDAVEQAKKARVPEAGRP